MSDPENDTDVPRREERERGVPQEQSKPNEIGAARAALPNPEPHEEYTRRKLPWILLLAFIMGLGTVGVGFVAATEKGLKWAFSMVARNIPGELHVDHLTGRLIGPLSLRGLRYTTAQKNITLSIEKVEADIRPLALLYERVHISRLDITGISYTQSPSSEPLAAPPDIQLPIGITLDQASITHLTVNLPQLKPSPWSQLLVDRITLSAKTLRGRLHIDSMVVESPSFQARARGTLTPIKDYPLSFIINWSASPQNYPVATGQSTLTGNLVKELNVSQNIHAPVRATLSGTVKSMFAAMQWQTTLIAGKTNINSINQRWPAIEIGGRLHLETQARDDGKSNRIIAEGSVQTTYQKYTLNTTARANFSDNQWYIEQATLALPDNPARILLKGALGEGLIPALSQSERPWQVTGRWQGIAWPLNATPNTTIIASKEGGFSLAGNLDAYQFTVEGDVQARAPVKSSTNVTSKTASMGGATLLSSHWTATGIGDHESLVLDEIRADILQGDLVAQGALRWPQPASSTTAKKSPLSWFVDITGSHLNPGQQWPAWPGQLNFHARIHNGEDSTEHPGAINLEISGLKGQLRGVPLDGEALLIIDNDTYAIPSLTLASGRSHLNASGTLNEAWNVQWEMDIHNINEFLPTARLKHSGTFQGKGLLTGPRERPHINAELHGNNLMMGEAYGIGNVRLLMDIDTQNKLPSQLDLMANGITIGDQRVENVMVKGHGLAQNHVIDATLKTHDKTLALRAEGALGKDIATFTTLDGAQTDIPLWTGQLTQANITSRALGSWPLTTPGSLTFTTDHAQVGPWCWTQQAAQVCVEANHTGKTGWQASAHTTNLPMNWLQPFLPPQAIVAGTFNAAATAYRSPDGLITGTAKVTPSAGAVVHQLADDQNLILAYTQGVIEATLDADTLNARAALTLTDKGTLDGALLLPRTTLPAFLHNPASAAQISQLPSAQTPPPAAAPIKAKLTAEIRELSVLPDFFPEIEDTQGKVAIALSVEGTMDQPRFNGYAKLEQGTALVPRLGLRLHDIQAQATGINEGQLSLTAQAKSGNGTLHLRGILRPGTKKSWGADLTVQGENFEAMRTPDIQATASPDLTVKIVGNTVDVNGSLTIPTAHIELRDLTTTVRPSSDVIIIRPNENTSGENGNPDTINNKGWMINSVIGVNLGNNITFKGVGLTGRFTGDLALIDTPQQVTTAYGEIRIEEGGEYRAVNQKLEVKKGGRLVFAGGPINNPGVDARATRQINANVRVGFNVRGTLQSPQLSVYSEPSMTETDALAYLLLGRPMNQATTAEGNQMAQAASSLGAAGGEFLIKKIGNTFGIEDIRVESSAVASSTGTPSTAQQATVVLGKYLSPKLYITYGVGTVDRINTLRLRYQLGRHWTVEAESGLHQGSDILYTIDKK